MDFMSDDFASFCPVMDLSTGNNNGNVKTSSSPTPSNGGEDGSSEAGGGSSSYMSSLRSRSSRHVGNNTTSPDDDSSNGTFSTKETFHLLDSVNKHLSELTNPKLKKYRIWVRIAEDVNKTCDAKFNGGQCSSRFRNLKCRFGKVQAQFKTTGELQTWPFYNRMLGMFPDEASFNWLNSAIDAKQEPEDCDDQMQQDDDDQTESQLMMMADEQDGEQEEEDEPETATKSSRNRGGHTAGFTTNSAGELVPCFTLRESMTLLDVVKKHIGELKDPRTCKGKIWAKVAAEVNKKCGCSHTGAQCSARYRNLKCRFLKRKQKGTDMTWTFGAKLASVLEAENEVKVEMAAAAGSLSDNNGSNQQHHQQLSSLLASGSGISSNGKMQNDDDVDDEPMPLKVAPSTRLNNQQQPADLRSHRSNNGGNITNHAHQSQPLDLHHTRHHSFNNHHHSTPLNALQQQQQRRRRSRISTGPRSRFSASPKDLLSSGQANLVSHASPIAASASAVGVDASVGGSSSGSDCFTASETVTLLDLVAKYLKDLNSPAESGVRRHDIWTRIAAELNDSYGTHYTSTQCSARFRNLKCRFIKTQEYNRVTGADKKVAFNDNIARLFAAETAMGGTSDSLNGSSANLAVMDNNSSSSEQISPMPMVKTAKSSSSLGYASPPTPSSLSHYSNNQSAINNSPPGAHNSASNAFQTQQQRPAQQQRLVPPPPSSPSVASNRSHSSTNGLKQQPQNNAGSAVHNGHQKTNGSTKPALANGNSSPSPYYDVNHREIQTAHSRSPSFALPHPVHLNNNRLQSPSVNSNINSRVNLSSSPNLFANRQPQPTSNCGVDLSSSQQQSRQAVQTPVAVSSSRQNQAQQSRAGREAVIEQLRLMHDDWIRVTERRHQEIMDVLRQLASRMTTAGLTVPVSLVDGAAAAALAMCQQPTNIDDRAEELLAGDVDDNETDEIMLPGDDAVKQQDDPDASLVYPDQNNDDNKAMILANGGEEIEEDEDDDADLASSISSTAVELAD